MVASLTRLALASIAFASTATASVKFDFKKHSIKAPQPLARRGHVEAALPEVAGVAYLMELGIGTPAQKFNIQFDTGSSNLWVQTADTAYCQDANNDCSATGTFNPDKSSTFTDIVSGFAIQYGIGSAAGDYVSDNVHLGSITLQNMTFGLATQVPDGSPTFGIVGAGLTSLEVAAQQQGVEFPTIIDALFNQGAISRKLFSVYLDDQEAGAGSVLFGAVDPSKYTGTLTSFPIAPNETGAYDRYRLDMTGISFTDSTGASTPLTTSPIASPVVLDTGASIIILPRTIATAIAKGLGAILYQNQIYLVDCALRNSAKAALNIQFSGTTTYSIPLSQLISDPGQDGQFPDGKQICQLQILGQDSDEVEVAGLGGFTLGDPFLRNVYVVYDQDAKQISLAQAKFNQTGDGNVQDVPSGTAGISQAGTTATALPTGISIPASLLTGGGGATTVDQGTAAAATATALTQNPASPTFSLATGGSGSSSSGSRSSGSNAGASLGISSGWMFVFGVATLALAVFL